MGYIIEKAAEVCHMTVNDVTCSECKAKSTFGIVFFYLLHLMLLLWFNNLLHCEVQEGHLVLLFLYISLFLNSTTFQYIVIQVATRLASTKIIILLLKLIDEPDKNQSTEISNQVNLLVIVPLDAWKRFGFIRFEDKRLFMFCLHFSVCTFNWLCAF